MSAQPTSRSVTDTTESNTTDSKVEYPEGVRSRKLCELINKSLTETINSFSYTKIATTFPELDREHRELLKRSYSTAVTAWEKECKEECLKILEKYDVRSKLNYIDHCIKNQKPLLPPKDSTIVLKNCQLSSSPSAKDLFEATPEELLKATEFQVVREELTRVKKRRQEVEEKNEALFEEINTMNSHLQGINTTFHEKLKRITSILNFNLSPNTSISNLDNTELLSTSKASATSRPTKILIPEESTEASDFVFL